MLALYDVIRFSENVDNHLLHIAHNEESLIFRRKKAMIKSVDSRLNAYSSLASCTEVLFLLLLFVIEFWRLKCFFGFGNYKERRTCEVQKGLSAIERNKVESV